MKKIIHMDKKILTPSDRFAINQDNRKPVRGVVKITNSRGETVGENLVVLTGREYLAEKLASLDGSATPNYLNYKLRYFGIGSGGAENDPNTGDPTVKIGPYADDTDLYQAVKIASGNSSDGTTYIDNGYLKDITVDAAKGSGIFIEQETHNIPDGSGGNHDVTAYTTVRFTMFLNEDEPPAASKPFEFNEAALWAVEYDPNTNIPIMNSDGTCNKVLIAHFTTSSKFIEVNEGLRIDWYILT